MRHPFAGIIGPAQKPADQPEISPTSRRGLFGLVAGALAAGTVGLLAFGTKEAEAQRVTTLALGEEGTRPRPRPPGMRPTTLALGEEGTRPRPTTRMLGEEGTRRPRRRGWKK